MKKIKISRSIHHDKKSVRTALKNYTYNSYRGYYFMFTDKRTTARFISEYEDQINLAVIMINLVLADLYVIYRQNWKSIKVPKFYEVFRQPDFILDRLLGWEVDISEAINRVTVILSLTDEIAQALMSIATHVKDTSLIHVLKAIEQRIKDIETLLLNFGTNGPWTEYMHEHENGKLM